MWLLAEGVCAGVAPDDPEFARRAEAVRRLMEKAGVRVRLDLDAILTRRRPAMWDDILLYVAVGFAAQMIDGAIGMAYGVTASSVLLSAGVPPATASACVHAAEVFTTGASGYAHWRLGNVDRQLVMRLVLPGMIGGAIGAYALASFPAKRSGPGSAPTCSRSAS